ncbi:unnamed protein product [Hydatigera taeniaeformis]|uniref:Uncharacterized protein n=1 Tax=Hydatigena taeniaeformis TaxID=6205 RepID=A0A0R3WY54_HYDTA|nr:unnamed protein product [Hydatigera taeniaeformis]
MSARSDCVSLTPAEYIELRTLSDVPGLPEDEHLEEMDVADECPRRLRSRSHGRMWRSLAEPRVIFINTTPQADMMYQRCCCACHRYHCMYMGAEGYPLVDELAHLSKGSLSKGSGSKRNNKRISFNPDPEMRSTEGARYGTDGLDSVHTSRRTSVDLTKEPVQQSQAVSCSRITQHATVKPPPNCRPDASWTSGPAKYLPKDTEVQSPEAAAAAKATIKRVLESRMCDSVFGRSFDATETKSISKETPTFPISNSKSAKNKASKEEEDLNQNEDSNSMLVRRNEDVCLPNGEVEAAKQRFLNALARFQMGSSSKPG